jgi:hypothetical protein
MKLSGELPLTAFFPSSDRNRERRKGNVGPARKRAQTHATVDEPLAKKRKISVLQDHLLQEASGNTRTTKRKPNEAYPFRKLARLSNATCSKRPSLLLTPQVSPSVPLPGELIEISDDELERNEPARCHRTGDRNSTALGEECSSTKQALQTPPITVRPNRRNVACMFTLDSVSPVHSRNARTSLSTSIVPIPWQTPGTPMVCSTGSQHHKNKTSVTAWKSISAAPVTLLTKRRPMPLNSPPSTISPAHRAEARRKRVNTKTHQLGDSSRLTDVRSFWGNELTQDSELASDDDSDPFVSCVPSQMIVPSSQTQDLRFPFPDPSSQVAPAMPSTESSPKFKIPALPLDSHMASAFLSLTSPRRTEDLFVPSSQTQCMTACEISPRRFRNGNHHSGSLSTLREIVPSSQVFLERELSISRCLSPIHSVRASEIQDLGASCTGPNV